MRFMKTLALAYGCFALAACGSVDDRGGGGSGTGTPSLFPTTHKLLQSMPVSIAAGAYYGFNFALPVAGTFRFSASQTTTDTWNVAVFSPAQWVSYQTGSGNMAYGGVHNNVMQAADSVSLPGGEWYLGFRCNNSFLRCMFVVSAEADY
jgi:hypothetical protein